jgi:hypothetical protein
MNNKAVRLIRAHKSAEARIALEAEKTIFSPDNYRALDTMVLEAELADLINGSRSVADAEAVLARINGEWDRLPEKSRSEMRTTAVLKKVEQLGKAGDWGGAITWINWSIENYGKNNQLENVLRISRENRISELHNGFAALYNKKDFSGAKNFIEKAIEEFPGDRQLSQDLSLVEQTLSRQ